MFFPGWQDYPVPVGYSFEVDATGFEIFHFVIPNAGCVGRQGARNRSDRQFRPDETVGSDSENIAFIDKILLAGDPDSRVIGVFVGNRTSNDRSSPRCGNIRIRNDDITRPVRPVITSSMRVVSQSAYYAAGIAKW